MKAVNDVVSTIQTVRAKAAAQGRNCPIAPTQRIEQRVLMHLVAMGVGRPPQHRTSPSPSSLSWCNGYPLLQNGPVDLESLKYLDRGRTLAMKALRRRLTALVNSSNNNAKGSWRHALEESVAPRRFRLRYAEVVNENETVFFMN